MHGKTDFTLIACHNIRVRWISSSNILYQYMIPFQDSRAPIFAPLQLENFETGILARAAQKVAMIRDPYYIVGTSTIKSMMWFFNSYFDRLR